MAFRRFFVPDFNRYEGVRPVQVLAARVGYLLVFAFVGQRSLAALVDHQGAWEPVPAAALAMWAAHALLSFLGILHPLEMLPLALFEIAYKVIWLSTVAAPLWASGQLAGSASEDMTYAFLWVLAPIVAMPWGYVFHKYIGGGRGPAAAQRKIPAS